MALIPIEKALLPAEFWTRWEAMDRRAQDAHLIGTMQSMHLKMDDIHKRIDELDDILSDLMEE